MSPGVALGRCILQYPMMGCWLLRRLTVRGRKNLTVGIMAATTLVLGTWVLHSVGYVDVAPGSPDEPPGLPGLTLAWEPVAEDDAYVVSAFLDRRVADVVVRVIAMHRLDRNARLCLLWMPWKREPVVTRATFKVVPESHNKDFWVCIYSCPIKENKIPQEISLVRDFTTSPTNKLQVIDLLAVDNEIIVPQEFMLCVAVVHSDYNNYRELVEAIELNEMFGVQKIIIYHYSIGHDVARFLKYYIAEGLVELVKWTLPVSEDEIHYFGQVAAINDCIYRTMYRTKFLLFSDLDEIIVPRKFPTLTEAMAGVITRSNLRAVWSGAFLLRNAFFPLDCEDQPVLREQALVRQYRLRSLLKTIRLSQMWPHLVRSKYILRPEAVTLAGVHYMWGFVGNFTHYNVSASVATLHHYRRYLNGCDDWAEDDFMWMRDYTLLKYKRQITKRVWKVMSTVGGECEPNKSKSRLR